MTNIKSLFDNIAKIWLKQLPLFIMVVIYTTAPAFFTGWHNPKIDMFILLPQVVLPSMLLCIVASWRRWSWWLVFIFANLLWLIEMGCYFCQHQRMWSYLALIIAQSNPRESGEYLSFMYENILKALLTVVASASVFYMFDRYWRMKSKYIIQKLQMGNRLIMMRCVGIIIALSVIYTPFTIHSTASKFQYYHQRIFWSDDLELACTWTIYVYALRDTLHNPDIWALPQLVETVSNTEITLDGPTDSLTIIYVIGESFSRNRSSLYGYPYDTNPLMAKEFTDSSLIIFDNVISFSVYTQRVYRTMLSTYNMQDDKPFESYPLLPAIMKKAGYKVAYLDNQQSIANGVGDAACTYFLGEYQIRGYCFDMYNDDIEAFDADFVNKYPSPYIDSGENSLTIYHLMGQHHAFNKRYPESFTHFTKADYENFEGLSQNGAKIMSEFDNATRYNDFTLHTIIDKIRDKTAILIYAPDHGEEAYDYREAGMRSLDGPITGIRLYHEVPVMIWMSDSFRHKYPIIVDGMRNNTHKAIYNSDLPHTILDIAGIYTDTFNPDVSLLRDGEGRTHRHVTLFGADYDAMYDEIHSQKLRYEK